MTLDFGIVVTPTLSRPLQLTELGAWHLKLWVPSRLCRTRALASKAFQARKLPLVLPTAELPSWNDPPFVDYEPCLKCNSFLEARTVLESGKLAAILPDFLSVRTASQGFLSVPIPAIESVVHSYRLAWNPRLLRLNPDAGRERDELCRVLTASLRIAKVNGKRAIARKA